MFHIFWQPHMSSISQLIFNYTLKNLILFGLLINNLSSINLLFIIQLIFNQGLIQHLLLQNLLKNSVEFAVSHWTVLLTLFPILVTIGCKIT